MVNTFLLHQWKSFWRSRSAGRNIALQIFIAFIVLYFLIIALVLGFSLDEILSKSFPKEDPVNLFLSFILYYFSFDFITRFIMQDLPTLSVQPYLTQNIKRNQLVQFLNLRSLFSVFLFLPFFLFSPFIIEVIGGKYGSTVSVALIICIIGITFFNHFLVLFIKRKTILNQWWLISFFSLILLFIAADYYQVFSLRNLSVSLFTSVIKAPLLSILFLLVAFAAYFINTAFLRKNLYLENLQKSAREKTSTDLTWLQKFGNIGEMIAVDIKLILRNKRPRTLLLLSVIFLFLRFHFFQAGIF